MKIAMLAPRPTVRGPLPKHTPLLVDALRRLGCEVSLLPWGRRADKESAVVKVVGRLKDVREAHSIVSRTKPSVVVVKTAHDWSTLARDRVLMWALAGRGRVIVLQFHGSQSGRLVAPGSRLFKYATAALVASADALLVLSTEEQQEWQAFSPNSRVLTVRNPRPFVADVTGVEKRGDPMILCVARLVAEKGVLDLVRALPQIREKVSCRLVLAGDGPEAGTVRELASELGVAEFVDLQGYVDGERLARLYREADVFALPTYWDEGFPTVILEAMAVGLPILTTRSRGPADHLLEGRNALFVPPRSHKELAASIVRLLTDQELQERMRQANREKVLEFEPDSVAKEYLTALESIVAGAI